MLAKKNRLTTKEFKNVGRFSLYRGEFFDAKKSEIFSHKYAVVLSKKTFKLAVQRNKVRRLFYRILYETLKNTIKQKSFTILFYPKKNTGRDTMVSIIQEIQAYLSKL